jgi:hypothetical protein
MRSYEILTESAKLSVAGFTEWRKTAFIEHGMDMIDYVIDADYHGNMLRFIMAGNAFKNSMPDPLTVYRGLHIEDPQDWSKNLVRGVGRNLGTSWTHEFSVAINENGPDGGFGRAMQGPTNVVLVANVPHESVDWYTSFIINAIDNDEPEIRLHKGAQVHLDEALLVNFSNRDWRDKVGRNHVTRSLPLNLQLKA